jgi:hypothetical protein
LFIFFIIIGSLFAIPGIICLIVLKKNKLLNKTNLVYAIINLISLSILMLNLLLSPLKHKAYFGFFPQEEQIKSMTYTEFFLAELTLSVVIKFVVEVFLYLYFIKDKFVFGKGFFKSRRLLLFSIIFAYLVVSVSFLAGHLFSNEVLTITYQSFVTMLFSYLVIAYVILRQFQRIKVTNNLFKTLPLLFADILVSCLTISIFTYTYLTNDIDRWRAFAVPYNDLQGQLDYWGFGEYFVFGVWLIIYISYEIIDGCFIKKNAKTVIKDSTI